MRTGDRDSDCDGGVRCGRSPRALVIGGTGPTGPFVVEGLHERGFDVTILHGGQHEYEFAVPGVRHIHEDPHFAETLERGVGAQTFELVVAQYGRLRVISEVLAGRTERLVAVGGATGIFAPDEDPRWGAHGKPALFADTSTVYVREPGDDGANKIGFRMVEAMNSALRAPRRRPLPRRPTSAIRRQLRPAHARVPTTGFGDPAGASSTGGATFVIAGAAGSPRRSTAACSPRTRRRRCCWSIDEPEASRRASAYSVADENAFTMGQRIEFIASHMGHEFEFVDMPYELAWPCYPLWRHVRGHRLTLSTS